jgi:hypothetical protein
LDDDFRSVRFPAEGRGAIGFRCSDLRTAMERFVLGRSVMGRSVNVDRHVSRRATTRQFAM